MMGKVLTKSDAKKAVYGGCILGGGGGGWIYDGLEKTEQVFDIGNPTLATVDELQDNDYAACVSLVGSPSADDWFVSADQYVSTVQRMKQEFNQPIKALMTNENGASATINGWVQSAATGLPILDAPCNGRAHPTGLMGSLNLSEIDDYVSIQAFAGGKGERKVEGMLNGSLDVTSSAIRDMSVHAGGMVGVCRNPVSIGYVQEHAAIGGISEAIKLGDVFLSETEGQKRIKAVTDYLGGDIISSGTVKHYELNATGGFDVGIININNLELTVWNEYMTAEIDGKRVGTFPDLIMTFDSQTGMPLVSAEITQGKDVTVINVPKENLKLSSTMFNETLLKAIEPIVDRKII